MILILLISDLHILTLTIRGKIGLSVNSLDNSDVQGELFQAKMPFEKILEINQLCLH